jgi:hypothetical protein
VYGDLTLYELTFDALDWDAYYQDFVSAIGVLSSDAILGTKAVDVLEQLTFDYANRTEQGDRSEYGVEFPFAEDTGHDADYAVIPSESVVLVATYLVE